MDKVLNRKLFRQKYLNTVKAKNLPKFKNGGDVDGNLGRTDMSDFGIKNLPEEKNTNTGNETFMGFGGEGSAVSADQARLNILLPIAAQLMTGTVRPGQSRLSGLLESAGKGLSAVGPTILAMKELDLKKRKEDREAAKTGSLNLIEVYDTLDGKTKKVPYALYTASPDQYEQASPKTTSFSVNQRIENPAKPGTYFEIAKDYTRSGDFVRNLAKEYPGIVLDTKGDLEKLMQMSVQEKELKERAKVKIGYEKQADNVLGLIQAAGRIESTSIAGALSGNVADTINTVNSAVKGLFESIVGRDPDAKNEFYDINREVRKAIEEGTLIYDNNKVGSPLSEKSRNKFLALNQAQKTQVIEFAYAIAKSREEGGRFSVTDIELALQSVGAGGDYKTFLSGVRTLTLDLSQNNLGKLMRVYDCADRTSCKNAGFNSRYMQLFDVVDSLSSGKGKFPEVGYIPNKLKEGSEKNDGEVNPDL
jgi:hypothetical protein